MPHHARFSIVTLALVAAACSDALLVPRSEGPRLSIEDALHHAGNQHFYWLPPIVAAPTYSGSFDGALSPVVEICEWTGTECALPLVAAFTTTTGPGSETVRVEATDELYVANWHTDEFGLDAGTTYRIAVWVDGQQLGHADVDVVSGGNQLKNVETDEFIALKDGRTLPIKFRIEEGAISSDPCLTVTIPDPILEAHVRGIVGVPTGPISGADVATLTTLDIRNKGVASLDGLECFTGLTGLAMDGNPITDLGPISDLTGLTGLTLRGTQVADLSPLSGLTGLTVLDISLLPITDISPLAPLTNMVALLMFKDHGVTDVGPLAGMTNLQTLNIQESPLGGTEVALAGLTQLKELTLTFAGVTDLGFMAGMANLTGVILSGNQITDLTPLSGLPALTFLWVPSNQLSDLTPLGAMTGLTNLNLFDNAGITDITPLGNLVNLTFLWMRNINVGTQASVLQSLVAMDNLRLDLAGLADLTFVSGMTALTSLSVSGNSIADATPLLGLSSLSAVDIRGNPLTCSDPVLVQLGANGVYVLADFTGGGSGVC